MRRRWKGKGEERWRDWDEVRRNVTIAVRYKGKRE